MKILKFTTNEKLTKLASGKLAKVISEDGEWAVSLTDKELSTLGALVRKNDLENQIEVNFENIDVNFEINRASKMIFLTYISNVWESERSFEYAKATLVEIELFEEKYGRSSIDFNGKEVIDTINGLGDRTNFYGLKFKIKVLKEYFDFYSKELGLKSKDNKWAQYYSSRKLSEILDTEERSVDLTRKNLVDLFNSMTNPQQGIIPLLVFEGLNFSKTDEVDEVRNLKIKDVHSEGIFVPSTTDEVDGRGFRLSVDREIEVER